MAEPSSRPATANYGELQRQLGALCDHATALHALSHGLSPGSGFHDQASRYVLQGMQQGLQVHVKLAQALAGWFDALEAEDKPFGTLPSTAREEDARARAARAESSP